VADYAEDLRREIALLDLDRILGRDRRFQIQWSPMDSELSISLRIGTLRLTLCAYGDVPMWPRKDLLFSWWSTPEVDGESAVTLGPLLVVAEVEPLTWTRRLLADAGRD